MMSILWDIGLNAIELFYQRGPIPHIIRRKLYFYGITAGKIGFGIISARSYWKKLNMKEIFEYTGVIDHWPEKQVFDGPNGEETIAYGGVYDVKIEGRNRLMHLWEELPKGTKVKIHIEAELPENMKNLDE